MVVLLAWWTHTNARCTAGECANHITIMVQFGLHLDRRMDRGALYGLWNLSKLRMDLRRGVLEAYV